MVSNGRLSALVIPDATQEGRDQLTQRLQRDADDKLPLYMRPAAHYMTESVPRSSSGKANRKAAARIITDREADAQAREEPCSDADVNQGEEDATPALELVKRLVTEIAEVSHTAVNAHSSLLRLGVDSLKAVGLLSMLRDASAKEPAGLGIADVLASTTIADIVVAGVSKEVDSKSAEVLGQAIAVFRKGAAASIGAVEDGGEAWPATPMQAGGLALHLCSEGGTGYINHSVFHLHPAIDVARLKKAWAGVVRRNGILRSRFVYVAKGAFC